VSVGTEPIDYLTVDDLLEIAAGIVDHVEVRDIGLLASATARPAATVFGAEAYPSFPEKVAALLHALARNHPLLDGNKGLAWSAARVFCLMNGRDLRFGVDEAEALMLAVATGDLDVPDLTTASELHGAFR
jgi:death-on-curing protein